MPGILALIPAVVWRWGAILALGAALFGYGYLRGHEAGKAAGEADLAHFRALVEDQATRQAQRTAQITAQQEAVSVQTVSDYRQQLAALRARGVPITRPDGSPVPEVSCPARGPDGTPADPVPAPAVEAVSKADFDQLAGLAAQTTLQLVKLQDWIRQQQALVP